MTNNCKIVFFFEDHRNMKGLKAVTTLLPFFKERGFKTIAVEETAEKSQRDMLKQYSDAYKKVQKGQMLDMKDFIEGNYLFVKNAISNGFSLKPIDVSRKDFDNFNRQSENKEQKILAQLDNYSTSNNIFDVEILMQEDYVAKLWVQLSQSVFVTKRDKNFVEKIDEICLETDAGIIVTLGAGHARTVGKLKELGYDDIKAFYFPFTVLSETETKDFQEYIYQYNPEIVRKTLFAFTETIDLERYSEDELVTYLQGLIESPVCLNDFCA